MNSLILNSTIINIVIANFAVILISAGVVVLYKYLNNKFILSLLLAFSSGLILTEAFTELIPKSLEEGGNMYYLLFGLVVFFISETIFHSGPGHNHEPGEEHIHTVNKNLVIQSLLVDGIHNFVDGLAVAAAFISSAATGWVVFLGIILHEVPQELSDLSLLKEAKLDSTKSYIYNTLVALTMGVGSLIGYLFASKFPVNLIANLELFTAGSLIFLAFSKMLPLAFKYNSSYNSNIFKRLTVLLALIAGGAFTILLHF